MIMYKRSSSRHQARNGILCIFCRKETRSSAVDRSKKLDFGPNSHLCLDGLILVRRTVLKSNFLIFLEGGTLSFSGPIFGKIIPIFELHVCTRGLFLDRGWETGILCISCGKETRYYLKADILSFPKC